MDEEYLKVQQKGGRPIPGQSLTNDPENPAAFEKAPEYTSVHAASEYLFAQMIERESYVPLMQAVADGTPIMEIAQVILFQGFTEGKWNPDLLIMLIEPVAYMLLALAERLDIDPVIYLDEEQDEEDEERALGTKFEELALQKFEKGSEPVKVPAGVLSNEILSQIKEIPEDALETPQQPMEQPPQQASLLAPAQ